MPSAKLATTFNARKGSFTLGKLDAARSLRALASGAWTVVRPRATISTTPANGTAIITVDDGNDGSIDHTWTFPLANLTSAQGGVQAPRRAGTRASDAVALRLLEARPVDALELLVDVVDHVAQEGDQAHVE